MSQKRIATTAVAAKIVREVLWQSRRRGAESEAEVTVFGRRLNVCCRNVRHAGLLDRRATQYELHGVRSTDWIEAVVAAIRNIGLRHPKSKSFCL